MNEQKLAAGAPRSAIARRHALNAWRELGEEMQRILSFLTPEQREDLCPDWFGPRLDAALRAGAEARPSKCCGVAAPDRSGRTCDKPEGHDGDHWTYGGATLTWRRAEALAPQLQKSEATNDDQSRSENRADRDRLQSSASTDGALSASAPNDEPALHWEGPDEDDDYIVSLSGFPNIAFTAHGTTRALALHRLGDQLFECFTDNCEECAARNPPCSQCGGPHPFDTSIPSPTWNAAIRAANLPDYLCLPCIVKAFVAAGQSFTATLWGDGLDGDEIEVTVNSAYSQDVERLSAENNELRVKLRAEALAPSIPVAAIDALLTWWSTDHNADPMTAMQRLMAIRDQFRRAEALAPPAPGWQPIESYVRVQGEDILIFVDSITAIAYWGGAHEHDWRCALPRQISRPTHWMPLPAPPRAEAREARPLEKENTDDVSR